MPENSEHGGSREEQLLRRASDRLCRGLTLDEDQARQAFLAMVHEEVPDVLRAAFLVALRATGETTSVVLGGVRALRSLMRPVETPFRVIDVVGTGGDGHGTYNISSLAAIVVAGCGVPVAKHGNRAMSSRSGAADLFRAAGVDIERIGPIEAAEALGHCGLTFLHAPLYHPVLRVPADVRRILGFPTVMNILGPLCNPCGTVDGLFGASDPAIAEIMAGVLAGLGGTCRVVHGADGLDELSTTGVNRLWCVGGGEVTETTLDPLDFGLPRVTLEALRGGVPEENARAMLDVLRGEGSPALRDAVLLNAAVALGVAGRVRDVPAGLVMARAALDSGAALACLDALRDFTTALAAGPPA